MRMPEPWKILTEHFIRKVIKPQRLTEEARKITKEMQSITEEAAYIAARATQLRRQALQKNPKELQRIFIREAIQRNLSYPEIMVFLGLGHVESDWRPQVVGDKELGGSFGVFQVLRSNLAQLGLSPSEVQADPVLGIRAALALYQRSIRPQIQRHFGTAGWRLRWGMSDKELQTWFQSPVNQKLLTYLIAVGWQQGAGALRRALEGEPILPYPHYLRRDPSGQTYARQVLAKFEKGAQETFQQVRDVSIRSLQKAGQELAQAIQQLSQPISPSTVAQRTSRIPLPMIPSPTAITPDFLKRAETLYSTWKGTREAFRQKGIGLPKGFPDTETDFIDQLMTPFQAEEPRKKANIRLGLQGYLTTSNPATKKRFALELLRLTATTPARPEIISGAGKVREAVKKIPFPILGGIVQPFISLAEVAWGFTSGLAGDLTGLCLAACWAVDPGFDRHFRQRDTNLQAYYQYARRRNLDTFQADVGRRAFLNFYNAWNKWSVKEKASKTLFWLWRLITETIGTPIWVIGTELEKRRRGGAMLRRLGEGFRSTALVGMEREAEVLVKSREWREQHSQNAVIFLMLNGQHHLVTPEGKPTLEGWRQYAMMYVREGFEVALRYYLEGFFNPSLLDAAQYFFTNVAFSSPSLRSLTGVIATALATGGIGAGLRAGGIRLAQIPQTARLGQRLSRIGLITERYAVPAAVGEYPRFILQPIINRAILPAIQRAGRLTPETLRNWSRFSALAESAFSGAIWMAPSFTTPDIIGAAMMGGLLRVLIPATGQLVRRTLDTTPPGQKPNWTWHFINDPLIIDSAMQLGLLKGQFASDVFIAFSNLAKDPKTSHRILRALGPEWHQALTRYAHTGDPVAKLEAIKAVIRTSAEIGIPPPDVAGEIPPFLEQIDTLQKHWQRVLKEGRPEAIIQAADMTDAIVEAFEKNMGRIIMPFSRRALSIIAKMAGENFRRMSIGELPTAAITEMPVWIDNQMVKGIDKVPANVNALVEGDTVFVAQKRTVYLEGTPVATTSFELHPGIFRGLTPEGEARVEMTFVGKTRVERVPSRYKVITAFDPAYIWTDDVTKADFQRLKFPYQMTLDEYTAATKSARNARIQAIADFTKLIDEANAIISELENYPEMPADIKNSVEKLKDAVNVWRDAKEKLSRLFDGGPEITDPDAARIEHATFVNWAQDLKLDIPEHVFDAHPELRRVTIDETPPLPGEELPSAVMPEPVEAMPPPVPEPEGLTILPLEHRASEVKIYADLPTYSDLLEEEPLLLLLNAALFDTRKPLEASLRRITIARNLDEASRAEFERVAQGLGLKTITQKVIFPDAEPKYIAMAWNPDKMDIEGENKAQKLFDIFTREVIGEAVEPVEKIELGRALGYDDVTISNLFNRMLTVIQERGKKEGWSPPLIEVYGKIRDAFKELPSITQDINLQARILNSTKINDMINEVVKVKRAKYRQQVISNIKATLRHHWNDPVSALQAGDTITKKMARAIINELALTLPPTGRDVIKNIPVGEALSRLAEVDVFLPPTEPPKMAVMAQLSPVDVGLRALHSIISRFETPEDFLTHGTLLPALIQSACSILDLGIKPKINVRLGDTLRINQSGEFIIPREIYHRAFELWRKRIISFIAEANKPDVIIGKVPNFLFDLAQTITPEETARLFNEYQECVRAQFSDVIEDVGIIVSPFDNPVVVWGEEAAQVRATYPLPPLTKIPLMWDIIKAAQNSPNEDIRRWGQLLATQGLGIHLWLPVMSVPRGAWDYPVGEFRGALSPIEESPQAFVVPWANAAVLMHEVLHGIDLSWAHLYYRASPDIHKPTFSNFYFALTRAVALEELSKEQRLAIAQRRLVNSLPETSEECRRLGQEWGRTLSLAWVFRQRLMGEDVVRFNVFFKDVYAAFLRLLRSVLANPEYNDKTIHLRRGIIEGISEIAQVSEVPSDPVLSLIVMSRPQRMAFQKTLQASAERLQQQWVRLYEAYEQASAALRDRLQGRELTTDLLASDPEAAQLFYLQTSLSQAINTLNTERMLLENFARNMAITPAFMLDRLLESFSGLLSDADDVLSTLTRQWEPRLQYEQIPEFSDALFLSPDPRWHQLIYNIARLTNKLWRDIALVDTENLTNAVVKSLDVSPEWIRAVWHYAEVHTRKVDDVYDFLYSNKDVWQKAGREYWNTYVNESETHPVMLRAALTAIKQNPAITDTLRQSLERVATILDEANFRGMCIWGTTQALRGMAERAANNPVEWLRENLIPSLNNQMILAAIKENPYVMTYLFEFTRNLSQRLAEQGICFPGIAMSKLVATYIKTIAPSVMHAKVLWNAITEALRARGATATDFAHAFRSFQNQIRVWVDIWQPLLLLPVDEMLMPALVSLLKRTGISPDQLASIYQTLVNAMVEDISYLGTGNIGVAIQDLLRPPIKSHLSIALTNRYPEYSKLFPEKKALSFRQWGNLPGDKILPFSQERKVPDYAMPIMYGYKIPEIWMWDVFRATQKLWDSKFPEINRLKNTPMTWDFYNLIHEWRSGIFDVETLEMFEGFIRVLGRTLKVSPETVRDYPEHRALYWLIKILDTPAEARKPLIASRETFDAINIIGRYIYAMRELLCWAADISRQVVMVEEMPVADYKRLANQLTMQLRETTKVPPLENPFMMALRADTSGALRGRVDDIMSRLEGAGEAVFMDEANKYLRNVADLAIEIYVTQKAEVEGLTEAAKRELQNRLRHLFNTDLAAFSKEIDFNAREVAEHFLTNFETVLWEIDPDQSNLPEIATIRKYQWLLHEIEEGESLDDPGRVEAALRSAYNDLGEEYFGGRSFDEVPVTEIVSAIEEVLQDNLDAVHNTISQQFSLPSTTVSALLDWHYRRRGASRFGALAGLGIFAGLAYLTHLTGGLDFIHAALAHPYMPYALAAGGAGALISALSALLKRPMRLSVTVQALSRINQELSAYAMEVEKAQEEVKESLRLAADTVEDLHQRRLLLAIGEEIANERDILIFPDWIERLQQALRQSGNKAIYDRLNHLKTENLSALRKTLLQEVRNNVNQIFTIFFMQNLEKAFDNVISYLKANIEIALLKEALADPARQQKVASYYFTVKFIKRLRQAAKARQDMAVVGDKLIEDFLPTIITYTDQNQQRQKLTPADIGYAGQTVAQIFDQLVRPYFQGSATFDVLKGSDHRAIINELNVVLPTFRQLLKDELQRTIRTDFTPADAQRTLLIPLEQLISALKDPAVLAVISSTDAAQIGFLSTLRWWMDAYNLYRNTGVIEVQPGSTLDKFQQLLRRFLAEVESELNKTDAGKRMLEDIDRFSNTRHYYHQLRELLRATGHKPDTFWKAVVDKIEKWSYALFFPKGLERWAAPRGIIAERFFPHVAHWFDSLVGRVEAQATSAHFRLTQKPVNPEIFALVYDQQPDWFKNDPVVQSFYRGAIAIGEKFRPYMMWQALQGKQISIAKDLALHHPTYTVEQWQAALDELFGRLYKDLEISGFGQAVDKLTQAPEGMKQLLKNDQERLKRLLYPQVLLADYITQYVTTVAMAEEFLVADPKICPIERRYLPQWGDVWLDEIARAMDADVADAWRRATGLPRLRARFLLKRKGAAQVPIAHAADMLERYWYASFWYAAIKPSVPAMEAIYKLLPPHIQPMISFYYNALLRPSLISGQGYRDYFMRAMQATADPWSVYFAARKAIDNKLHQYNDSARILGNILGAIQVANLVYNVESVLRQATSIVPLTARLIADHGFYGALWIALRTPRALLAPLARFLKWKTPFSSMDLPEAIASAAPALAERRYMSLSRLEAHRRGRMMQSLSQVQTTARRVVDAILQRPEWAALLAAALDETNPRRQREALREFMMLAENDIGLHQKFIEFGMSALQGLDWLMVKIAGESAAMAALTERFVRNNGYLSDADIRHAIHYAHSMAATTQATPGFSWQPPAWMGRWLGMLLAAAYKQFVVYTFALSNIGRRIFGQPALSTLDITEGIVKKDPGKLSRAVDELAKGLMAASFFVIGGLLTNAWARQISGRALEETPLTQYPAQEEDLTVLGALRNILVTGVPAPLQRLVTTVFQLMDFPPERPTPVGMQMQLPPLFQLATIFVERMPRVGKGIVYHFETGKEIGLGEAIMSQLKGPPETRPAQLADVLQGIFLLSTARFPQMRWAAELPWGQIEKGLRGMLLPPYDPTAPSWQQAVVRTLFGAPISFRTGDYMAGRGPVQLLKETIKKGQYPTLTHAKIATFFDTTKYVSAADIVKALQQYMTVALAPADKSTVSALINNPYLVFNFAPHHPFAQALRAWEEARRDKTKAVNFAITNPDWFLLMAHWNSQFVEQFVPPPDIDLHAWLLGLGVPVLPQEAERLFMTIRLAQNIIYRGLSLNQLWSKRLERMIKEERQRTEEALKRQREYIQEKQRELELQRPQEILKL